MIDTDSNQQLSLLLHAEKSFLQCFSGLFQKLMSQSNTQITDTQILSAFVHLRNANHPLMLCSL